MEGEDTSIGLANPPAHTDHGQQFTSAAEVDAACKQEQPLWLTRGVEV